MIDISVVSSLPSEKPWLELPEYDLALDQVISLAERNKFAAAAEQAVQLWRQTLDVRLLGFILFGSFLEQGLPALSGIARAIEAATTTSWPSLGPGKGKQRHCDVALRWLFINIVGQLRFYQRVQGESWEAFRNQWQSAPQQQILDLLETLAERLGEALPAPNNTCVRQLHGLRALLQAMPSTIVSTIAKPMASAPAQVELLLPEYQRMEPEAQAPSAPENPPTALESISPPAAVSPAEGSVLAVPLSPPMKLLLRKLAAFNTAVKADKFRQAAIIYTDVRKTIDHFDPRAHLPTLFGEFFSNLVAHADKLTKNLGTTDDFAGKALLELYQTDLDRFLLAKG